MLGSLILGGLKVVEKALETDSQDRESDNQRSIENTKTLVNGAVAVAGIAGLAYVAGKVLDSSTDTNNSRSVDSLEAGAVPLLNNPQDSLIVNRDSVWFDKASSEFGADVMDRESGVIYKIVYNVKPIRHKVYQVYKNENGGEWLEAGVVDWNKMSISSLENSGGEGRIFAQISKVAFGLS